MSAQRVAIIGWGSLIWDLDDLAPKVDGAWALGVGPVLPVEFCRISPKRLGALALAIDLDHGADCATAVIASRRAAPPAAVEDLAARERAPVERIGWVDARTGRDAGRAPEVVARVRAWCDATGWDGAVWTDLPPNFTEMTGAPFSVSAARARLRMLEGAALAEAVRYVDRAPRETDTPLRRALVADPWWRGLPREAG